MTVTRKCAAAVIVAAILVQKSKKRINKKRLWAREYVRRRETDNVVQIMMEDLRNDSTDTFTKFFRMSSFEFDFLTNCAISSQREIQICAKLYRQKLGWRLRFVIYLRAIRTDL